MTLSMTDVLGPHNELPVIGIYGDMSSGKDFDAWTALAGRCFVVGPPGGISKPAVASGYGLDPKLFGGARTIEAATQRIRATVQAFPRRFLGVIVTDVSVLSAGTFNALRPQIPKNKNFEFWERFGMIHTEFVEVIRWCGLLGIMSGHVKVGGVNKIDGRFYKGGLKTPGRETTKILTHSLDMALRCGSDPDRYGPWKGVYYARNNHPDWHQKDRHHSPGFEVIPQNVAELLRLAGYRLPRPPGLEWQEQWVEGIAQKVVAGASPRKVAPKVIRHLQAKGVPEALTYWTVRDGLDRASLRQISANQLINAF